MKKIFTSFLLSNALFFSASANTYSASLYGNPKLRKRLSFVCDAQKLYGDKWEDFRTDVIIIAPTADVAVYSWYKLFVEDGYSETNPDLPLNRINISCSLETDAHAQARAKAQESQN